MPFDLRDIRSRHDTLCPAHYRSRARVYNNSPRRRPRSGASYIPVQPHVLVVDDDRSIRRSLEKFLTDLGYLVSTAEDGAQALAAIERGDKDVVLLDLGLPVIDGLEVLSRLEGREGTAPVIVITARDDMKSTITAIQRGAYDYLVKPLDIERLKIALRRALESRELAQRLDNLIETIARDYQVGNIVGRTAAMREVFKTIGTEVSAKKEEIN